MTKGGGESGFSLVAIVAGIAVMLILMTAAVPAWRYVMQDAREEELIFRGGQIADAVARYQKKNASALPVSLEVLVKGKYLRKAYKDPMTKDGKWRFLRAGEAGVPGSAARAPGAAGGPGPAPSASPGGDGDQPPQAAPSPSAFGPAQPQGSASGSAGAGDAGFGGFVGVASRATDTSYRLLNGRSRYSDWLFIAGQPRVVGAMPALPMPGAAPGGAPGAGGPPVTQRPRRP